MRKIVAACMLAVMALGSTLSADTPSNFCATKPLHQLRAAQFGNQTRTRGTKKVLVARPTFSNDAADPFPAEHQIILEQVRQFFDKNSYGLLQLEFTVSPLIPIPQEKEFYRFRNYDLQLELSAALEAAGISLAAYEFVTVFTRSYLDGGGVADVGGKFSTCGYGAEGGVLAHELGHSLGLHHANAWRGKNNSSIGRGDPVEYGNPFDTMGRWIEDFRNCHFNAYAKHQLGWLPDTVIASPQASTNILLSPFDTGFIDFTRAHAIRIPKEGREYWIELRSALQHQEWAADGVFLTWSPSPLFGTSSHILDAHPTTSRHRIDPLRLGQSLTDPHAGVTITPLRRVGEAIELAINFHDGQSNTAPALNLAADKAFAAVDEPILFNAIASDPEGDDLSYSWYFSDDTRASGATVTKSFPFPSFGAAYCCVSDRKGGVTWKTLNLKVGENSGRTVAGSVLADGKPVAGAHIEAQHFEAFTDANGRFVLPTHWENITIKAFKGELEFQPHGFENPVVTDSNPTEINFQLPPFTDQLVISRNWLGSPLVSWPETALGTVLQVSPSPSGPWTDIHSSRLQYHYDVPSTENSSGIFRLQREY